MNHRVVVTGIGAISPFGVGLQVYFDGLKAGKSGVCRIDDLMQLNGCRSRTGAKVQNFNPLDYMSNKSSRRMDRFAQFGVAATKMALQDAGFNLEDPRLHNAGVFFGTAVGGFPYGEVQHERFIRRGLSKVDPLLCSRVFYGCGVNEICIELKIGGFVQSLTTGCVASADAIGSAFSLIREGKSDIVICGGADAPLAPLTYSSFYLIGVTSTKLANSPAPYDLTRDGIVLGEGAGILILEDRESALKRGARVYAELVGYGTTHDAYHLTKPAPDGRRVEEAMMLAFRDAHIDPAQVDHIASHGCGTQISDQIETEVLKRVFKNHVTQLTISAIESMIGHPLGAVGALKSIAAILSIQNSVVFPTINYQTPDPVCNLDYVPNRSKEKEVNIAMVNAFSFGGKNSILLFKKHYVND